MQILIDVDYVMEVFDPPRDRQQVADSASMTGHYSWRGQIVHVIDMPKYFGMNDVHSGRLIVIDTRMDDPALRFIVLSVEASENLLALEDRDITDMADHNDRLAPVFQSIYSPVDSSACLLVLRFPANWILPVITGTEAA